MDEITLTSAKYIEEFILYWAPGCSKELHNNHIVSLSVNGPIDALIKAFRNILLIENNMGLLRKTIIEACESKGEPIVSIHLFWNKKIDSTINNHPHWAIIAINTMDFDSFFRTEKLSDLYRSIYDLTQISCNPTYPYLAAISFDSQFPFALKESIIEKYSLAHVCGFGLNKEGNFDRKGENYIQRIYNTICYVRCSVTHDN